MEALPQRAQLRLAPQHPAYASRHALLGVEVVDALRRVAGWIDGDRERGEVVADVVERALDLLRLHRARVLAVAVHERDDHGLAAVLAHRHALAVLVLQIEVGSTHAGRQLGPLEGALGGHDGAARLGARGVVLAYPEG